MSAVAPDISAFGYRQELKRALSLRDLLVYGLVFIIPTAVPGLSIVPADRNLTGAEIEMVPLPGRESQLRRFLNPLRDRCDHVFLDCPPSLGLLTLNALVAADGVMIPLHCEYFALEGLADLMTTLRRVRAGMNPDLDVDSVLLTMYDERTNLSAAVASDLRDFYGQQVFEAVIPRNVRLAEAPSYGKPIVLYDIRSKGAEAYFQLAKEILAHDTKGTGSGAERFAVG